MVIVCLLPSYIKKSCCRYLAALGKTRTAQIQRDARIGEAESRRDAGMKEAVANQERLKVRFENDTEIAKAKRDYEVKKADYDIEVSFNLYQLCNSFIAACRSNTSYCNRLSVAILISSVFPINLFCSLVENCIGCHRHFVNF